MLIQIRVLDFVKIADVQLLVFAFFLGTSLVAWKSKKQQVVSKSSTEAEYRSLSVVTDDLMWFTNFVKELCFSLSKPTMLFCDNTAAIHIVRNIVFHERTKNVEIDCYSVREIPVSGLFK